ncbi:3-deoxy-D-manno-oct-2-ulosonate III transferase WaaZ [Pseudocitrobacter corydidari]
MKHIKYITHADVQSLIEQKTSDDAIIFLSGPTSKKTPLSVLESKDVITVNGSADYLLSHNIAPFIYILTDARFLHQRRDDFYRFSRGSRFTIVNTDVYEEASEEDKKYLRENCHILKAFYKREKGGFAKKVKLAVLRRLYRNLLIKVPFSKRGRLVGFCKDIAIGYCSCHTVAYTAIQIAYSLCYSRIVCSGLDLTGTCQRFYDESNNPMPSELSKDLHKILPFFKFMSRNVPDMRIYNLSDDTAISYDIIPFIEVSELADTTPKKIVDTKKKFTSDDARVHA